MHVSSAILAEGRHYHEITVASLYYQENNIFVSRKHICQSMDVRYYVSLNLTLNSSYVASRMCCGLPDIEVYDTALYITQILLNLQDYLYYNCVCLVNANSYFCTFIGYYRHHGILHWTFINLQHKVNSYK